MVLTLAIWAFLAMAVAAFAAIYLVLRIRQAHEATLQHTAEEEDVYRLAKARLIHRRELKQRASDPLTAIFGVDTPTHLRMR